MAKKLKVWLNNKLNKRLRCTVVIKFFRIFITELVLTFFVFKCPNYFEFLKCGKRSPHFKILEIPGGRGGHQRPPGTENPGGWGGANQSVFRGGGMDIFWNHTMLWCGFRITQMSKIKSALPLVLKLLSLLHCFF